MHMLYTYKNEAYRAEPISASQAPPIEYSTHPRTNLSVGVRVNGSTARNVPSYRSASLWLSQFQNRTGNFAFTGGIT